MLLSKQHRSAVKLFKSNVRPPVTDNFLRKFLTLRRIKAGARLHQHNEIHFHLFAPSFPPYDHIANCSNGFKFLYNLRNITKYISPVASVHSSELIPATIRPHTMHGFTISITDCIINNKSE
jgi:hypothetical protein